MKPLRILARLPILILAFVVVDASSIIIHETAHYAADKAAGIRVEHVKYGMSGPLLASWHFRETKFYLRAGVFWRGGGETARAEDDFRLPAFIFFVSSGAAVSGLLLVLIGRLLFRRIPATVFAVFFLATAFFPYGLIALWLCNDLRDIRQVLKSRRENRPLPHQPPGIIAACAVAALRLLGLSAAAAFMSSLAFEGYNLSPFEQGLDGQRVMDVLLYSSLLRFGPGWTALMLAAPLSLMLFVKALKVHLRMKTRLERRDAGLQEVEDELPPYLELPDLPGLEGRTDRP